MNKLWFLGTFHTIILAFRYDCLCRNTLVPETVMFEDELGTQGGAGDKIFEFLRKSHVFTVGERTNFGFW